MTSSRAPDVTTATGAWGVPGSPAMTAPRMRPIPRENNRVTSSAPTKLCHCRMTSSRRTAARPAARGGVSIPCVVVIHDAEQPIAYDRPIALGPGYLVGERRKPRDGSAQRLRGNLAPSIAVVFERVNLARPAGPRSPA